MPAIHGSWRSVGFKIDLPGRRQRRLHHRHQLQDLRHPIDRLLTQRVLVHLGLHRQEGRDHRVLGADHHAVDAVLVGVVVELEDLVALGQGLGCQLAQVAL